MAEQQYLRMAELLRAGPCDRCGKTVDAAGCFADEICRQCGHVPLCFDCSILHTCEALADDVAVLPGVEE